MAVKCNSLDEMKIRFKAKGASFRGRVKARAVKNALEVDED